MRTWQRAKWPRHCGRCGVLLRVGDPFLAYEGAVGPIGTVKPITFVRCAECEGGAPPDLPALVERVVEQPAMVPVRQLMGLPLDWSRRAAGEREPGEEG